MDMIRTLKVSEYRTTQAIKYNKLFLFLYYTNYSKVFFFTFHMINNIYILQIQSPKNQQEIP